MIETMKTVDLADRLEALRNGHGEPWEIEQEPHNYDDGTDHFTHVRYRDQEHMVVVEVASHVTPRLGELLCLLHNNLPEIIKALRYHS